MRISDWSSDVCSSDLAACIGRTRKEKPELQDALAAFARTSTGLGQNLLRFALAVVLLYFGARWVVQSAPVIGLALGFAPPVTRSAERRVGKECVGKCRSRWSPVDSKKNSKFTTKSCIK